MSVSVGIEAGKNLIGRGGSSEDAGNAGIAVGLVEFKAINRDSQSGIRRDLRQKKV
jgi:hypothetical protein